MQVTPKQILTSMDMMGFTYSELDRIEHNKQSDVRTLLYLIDQLPTDLIALPFYEYVEFERCRSALATALPAWNLGSTQPAYSVGGKNAIARIRHLLAKCPDEPLPAEPEFPFIKDEDTRLGIEDRLHAAWIDFKAMEWLGATTFAAVVLEAILLWEVKRLQSAGNLKHKKTPDQMDLSELIDVVANENSISADSAKQAHLARDARNLIHPGKIARSGASCDKSTALAAFAAVYRVASDLKRGLASCGPL
jgi:hypothetical protein